MRRAVLQAVQKRIDYVSIAYHNYHHILHSLQMEADVQAYQAYVAFSKNRSRLINENHNGLSSPCKNKREQPMRSVSLPATPWLRIYQPKPHARLRLFCLPYAGGAASIYRVWSQYLPADIEVCAVQLPGRENRIREKPFRSIDSLMQPLLSNLLPFLDKPFALFGHSMGSLIAYEFAHLLEQQQQLKATKLFVSGRRSPLLPEPEQLLHTLESDDAFLTALQQRYRNIPAVIFDDHEMRALFVPLLRADLTLVESYQHSARTPLSTPIIGFGGDADRRVSDADLSAWQPLTQSGFHLHMFPGGHFYLEDQIQPLLSRIAAELQKASNE